MPFSQAAAAVVSGARKWHWRNDTDEFWISKRPARL